MIDDFILAAYTGYVQATPTFTGPKVLGTNGPVYYLSSEVTFVGASSGPGINCVGYVLQDSVSHTVWGWISLSDAVPLQIGSDVAGFVIELFESLQSIVATIPF